MRIIFKTRYDQDINLAPHGGVVFWYSLLAIALVAAPLIVAPFYVGEVSFLFIWSLAGLSLMVLTGYAGLISIGHAAFIGIGAYVHTYLIRRGVPFAPSLLLAGLAATVAGVVIAVPAIRMRGLYLAIATLAFSAIAQEVFVRWEVLTGGSRGVAVPKPQFFGRTIESETGFYYLCLSILVVCILGVLNLLRAPTGRAWIALRDSEIAAQSMGVYLAGYKVLAFAFSAFLAGIAGGLFAHKVGYLTPDIFTPILSIQLLMLVMVGGIGSIHGAIFGAIFLVLLPTVIALLRDYLPAAIAQQPALEPGIYGLILVFVVLLEPQGLNGLWRKIKFFFSQFPMYKSATFKRQKTYMRTERLQ
ncbi:branched-chain amino acid ABC transporter permease [Bradyrhizobium sp. AS23.2]|uniref:branched-chain amino acid ABC transporter permease n=1 Tax=Bradyrhizobium sp. AS23.2 TaxID=1680155 RepID=UPI0009393BE9|nr:branched-chain amino acid ABC transporter permease [Bradyrhizobium sp. AS23.2]OKO83039.1 ABC transporter permease [Bradyrhizobium sp. AS23.2]